MATYTAEIHAKARELLTSGQVRCVIGYEVGPRGRTRPAFVYHADDTDRQVWNQHCTHNLTVYLHDKLRPDPHHKADEIRPVAIVVKACDSRAIHVLLAENQIQREKLYIIGVS